MGKIQTRIDCLSEGNTVHNPTERHLTLQNATPQNKTNSKFPETKVNEVVHDWLLSKKRSFSGITTRNRDVPVPCCDNEGDGEGRVCLDFLSPDKEYHLWIESKGDNVGGTELLSALMKVCFAVYYQSGKGLVAAPSKQINWLLHHKEFIEPLVRMFELNTIGLFDVEKKVVMWI